MRGPGLPWVLAPRPGSCAQEGLCAPGSWEEPPSASGVFGCGLCRSRGQIKNNWGLGERVVLTFPVTLSMVVSVVPQCLRVTLKWTSDNNLLGLPLCFWVGRLGLSPQLQ